MEIRFARTRHVYDSYTDFWQLVRLSGYPVCYIDEMEMFNPNIIYITAPYNGEWSPHLDNYPDRTTKFAMWNLERPGDASVSAYAQSNHNLIDDKYFHYIIVSDRELARQCQLTYVPLGSHDRLGEPGSVKRYDAVHLMCYSLRRAFMFDYLTPRQHLRNLSIAPNGWGNARHNSLQSSRFMLNIHQDDHKFIEPLRFALAIAYGLPILSEWCIDPFPYTRGLALEWCEASEDDVVKTLERMCFSHRLFVYEALRVRDKMCNEFSFRNCIDRYFGETL